MLAFWLLDRLGASTMDNTNSKEDTAATGSDAARRIVDAGMSAVDQTKTAAQNVLHEGADKVADSTQAAAQTLRQAADEMPGDQSWIGAVLRKSAAGLETASKSISSGNVEGGLRELTHFAQRQPAVYLGAAFALGFALSRVGKTAIEKAVDESSGASNDAGSAREQAMHQGSIGVFPPSPVS